MRDCVTPTRQSAREPVAAELVLQTSTLSLRTACLPPRAYGLWGMAGRGGGRRLLAVLPEPFRSVREVRSVVGVASRVYTGRAGNVCTCVCRSGTWSTLPLSRRERRVAQGGRGGSVGARRVPKI